MKFLAGMASAVGALQRWKKQGVGQLFHAPLSPVRLHKGFLALVDASNTTVDAARNDAAKNVQVQQINLTVKEALWYSWTQSTKKRRNPKDLPLRRSPVNWNGGPYMWYRVFQISCSEDFGPEKAIGFV